MLTLTCWASPSLGAFSSSSCWSLLFNEMTWARGVDLGWIMRNTHEWKRERRESKSFRVSRSKNLQKMERKLCLRWQGEDIIISVHVENVKCSSPKNTPWSCYTFILSLSHRAPSPHFIMLIMPGMTAEHFYWIKHKSLGSHHMSAGVSLKLACRSSNSLESRSMLPGEIISKKKKTRGELFARSRFLIIHEIPPFQFVKLCTFVYTMLFHSHFIFRLHSQIVKIPLQGAAREKNSKK